jgi:hypothetical protein
MWSKTKSIKEDPMIRLNIQLTDEQDAQLRKLSYETRESVAAIIRKAVDEYLGNHTAPEQK